VAWHSQQLIEGHFCVVQLTRFYSGRSRLFYKINVKECVGDEFWKGYLMWLDIRKTWKIQGGKSRDSSYWRQLESLEVTWSQIWLRVIFLLLPPRLDQSRQQGLKTPVIVNSIDRSRWFRKIFRRKGVLVIYISSIILTELSIQTNSLSKMAVLDFRNRSPARCRHGQVTNAVVYNKTKAQQEKAHYRRLNGNSYCSFCLLYTCLTLKRANSVE
jgi:hypothetical protein